MTRLFAYRPKPREAEILSSWICRTAEGHRTKLHSFCNSVWPGRQIWNRDPDRSADSSVVETMALKTGTPLPVAEATHLRSYEGHLFEGLRPNARTPWIRELRVWHRKRLLPGLQFCPECLGADLDPYYRLQWRLGFIAVCVTHRAILRETCSCGVALNFHRSIARGGIALCAECHADLREMRCKRASPDVVAFQRHLEHVLACGGTTLGTYGRLSSLPYFTILHQILKMLASRKCSHRVLASIAADSGIRTCFGQDAIGGMRFEQLPPEMRHDLLRAVAVLLEAWPTRFVDLCTKARVWSSGALADLNEAPFALWDPVRRHLDRTFYRPNAHEVAAIRRYCENHGTRPSGHALRRITGQDSIRFHR
jgi:hypothetical protein